MLEAGTKAPAFDLEGDLQGERGRVALEDLRGKTVVLYFYPKDNTPGCTREAQAFTARKKQIEKLGAVVLGVSKDSVDSHGRFREKCGLGIDLLSDPDLSVHKAYGAYGEKTMYGKKVMGTIRSTFVIDPSGVIARVFPSVKVDGHDDAVMEAIGAIGGSPKSSIAPAKTSKAAAKTSKAPAKSGKAPAKGKAPKR
jgi:peroxiredoxin Q/BCP